MIEGVSFGDRARRYSRPAWSLTNPSALFASLRAVSGVVDVLITEEHVAVIRDPARARDSFDDDVSTALAADSLLARGASDESRHALARDHVVVVRYDGLDLDHCALRLGLERDELVAIHTSVLYEVKLIGFLPGFAYLGDLDPRLVLPRRGAPRTRVPPWSVAIADAYAAVYPFASPGGWHLLGTAAPFDPFAFALGDHVRFEPS